MARHRRPIAVPPAPARDPLFLSIRTVGFSADVRVTDDRDVDEVIFAVARPGSRVTIVNRFGQTRTGRAVMRGPHGWVLNMGGAHGTPAIANDDNIVAVK